ncbi:flagellar hook-associated protein 3 FlgL [Desulfobaculum xiamenense]|uniref:Flagellar hook-associated protein 3 FlgL n=1 Tax=Desulfobaculum xiamenense TaxID=995050 RepID=A0A846QF69_9BACT|nr:flagellar hook-associated protein FlgL [Desulfobaculum xiamenense]NJB66978.1 flagellar hook-associated protein 3 FlgL [Desulfobaculum xiamenense]
MPIRVSHRSRFTFFIGNMNSSLADLMDLNTQAATQKKINKPSDNSSGMVRILDHRNTLNSIDKYQENVTEAKGWLGVADNKLTTINDILIQLRGLAEQAATGTMSPDNREQTSYQTRQLYEELVSLANTEYEGSYIFAGHKTDAQPYERALWVTDNDGSTTNADGSPRFSLTGDMERSALIRFTSAGTVGTDALTYEYSLDGGRTFDTGTIPAVAGDKTITIGGAQLTLDAGVTVTAKDPNVDSSTNNGTWMWVRPTARYKGDDVDTVGVDQFGNIPATVTSTAQGLFSGNIAVRLDGDATLTAGQSFTYSYSMDGGASWTTGQSATVPADGEVSIVVPGGHLDLAGNAGDTVTSGSQFNIHPRTGRIELQIGPNESIQINNIGKDVLGGVYASPDDGSVSLAPGLSNEKNLFDVVGRLVGYMETNNQNGCQECLANLNDVSIHIMDNAARVGASENRLAVTENILGTLEHNEETRLSAVEDADVSELMTELANQQIIYETVLRSSSMIMRMNLANFL